MIPERRARFNAAFDESRYLVLRRLIEARTGVPVEFPLSETPCFFRASLLDRLAAEAQALIDALLGDAAYRDAADAIVPPRFRVAHPEDAPTCVQVDFGLVETPKGIEGRLVELQAFPSLYAFQPVLAEAHLETWSLAGVTPFPDGLDRPAYDALVNRAIVGTHDPREVVLMEIDPHHQKTRPDFILTEQRYGVRAIDVREAVRRGRQLWYRRDGVLTPIRRVYNRVIPDELEHKGIVMPFDYRDDLDVEWVGGPDWFFRISKFSLPWMRHPWVPETLRLQDLDEWPAPREDWILKPLFSFAGGGIVFAPTDAQLAAIPPAERGQYILQRRVSFTPVIDTPYGPTQVEVRLMFVRDGDRYRFVLPLLRMGRGKMIGVDHNKGLRWVGASGALIE